MPETIGALVIEAVTDLSAAEAATAGFTIAGVTTTYASIVGATILAAASLAIASALMPSQQAPNGQVSLQQPVPFRRRAYGRVKMGGYYIFWNSQNGSFYQILAIASQEWDAIEEYWVGDRRVTIDGSGDVTAVNYPPDADVNQFNPGGFKAINIQARLGASGQTAYATLVAAWPGIWTTDCVGIGIVDALFIQRGVSSGNFSHVYPGGSQPLRVVGRAEKNIFDPRTNTTAWSDNAVLVLRDYLTHADGWRIPTSYFDTGLAAPIIKDSADVCDQLVPLVAGGTEPRYRIWGFYDFNEEPRQVLARMLAACAGWLQPQTDGTIAIRVGEWIAPDVTITDDHIIGFQVQHFVGEFDAVNEVRATFNYAANDYQQTESYPFDNDADIARRGYIKSNTLDCRHCPTFTQTRRIQKIALAEQSPDYTITLTTDAYGLAARNRRFIALDMSKSLGLTGNFRITSFVANLQTGVCTLGLASFDSTAYDWTPSTDEGPAPPVPPDDSSAAQIDVPQNLVVNVQTLSVNGSSDGTVAVCTVDPPASGRTDLIPKFEYQPAGGGAAWTTIPPGTASYEAQTGFIASGTYNFRISFLTVQGVQGEFLEVDGVIVTPATTAPGSPTGIAVTSPSGGHATPTATSPNSPNFYALRFWRNNTNTFSSATDISGPLYGSPNQGFSYADAPGTGTWYYWATAENNATPPARSAPDGSVSITV